MTVPAPAREFTPLPPAAPRRALGGVAVLLASVLMASCGGGDQVKKFEPTSFVSFGDESSALVSETVAGSAEPLKGLKYSMNSMGIVPGLEKDENNQPLFVPPLPEGAQVNRTGWLLYPTGPDAAAPVVVGNLAVRRTFTMDVSYKINGLPPDVLVEDSTVVYEYGYRCDQNRLWIQLLAQSRGLGFQGQCGLEAYGGAVSHAEAGARVSTDVTMSGVLRKSIKTQVAEHRGELNSGTMVTMLAGQNDILQAYAEVKAGTLGRDAAIQRMREQGRELAAIVNDITTTGARVVLATPPDLGKSPYARQESGYDLRNPQAVLLHDLTKSFRDGLVLNGGVINDGRKIALVPWFDETVNIETDVFERGGSYYGFTNNSTALCSGSTVHSPAGAAVTPASAPFFGGDELRYCTEYNIVSGGNSATYFWADEVNMSPGAHARLSNRAFEKIDGDNPL